MSLATGTEPQREPFKRLRAYFTKCASRQLKSTSVGRNFDSLGFGSGRLSTSIADLKAGK